MSRLNFPNTSCEYYIFLVRTRLRNAVQSWKTALASAICTIYALFAEDIRLAWCNENTDYIFTVFNFIVLVFFFIELILYMYISQGYM